MNNFDKQEYESTMEPMRNRLDWFYGAAVVLAWVVLGWILIAVGNFN